MRKRTLIPLLIAVAVLAALGMMFYLRAEAPPEAARLLPESDAIAYVNVKPLRAATHFDRSPTMRSPNFQHFIDATGIVPERDIDSVAFALHKVPILENGVRAADLFSSEVLIGRFDGEKLGKYLASIASSTETYAGHTLYTIQMDGQVLRVTQLTYDAIAASNMPTTEQIHAMLDRSRASALSTPGCSLLATRFKEVPLLSEAWAIGHIGLPFARNGAISVMGLELPIAPDSDLVASLRYSPAERMLSGGAVQLRIEEIAPTALAAKTTVDSLNTMLDLLRGLGGVEPARKDGDASLRQIVAATKLVQHDERAVLESSATLEQVKTLFNEHDPASETPAVTSSPASK